METKKNINSNQIELRSEKVRNIIGTIPSALVRWGIAVITIIFITLMFVIFLVPYPYGEGETIFQHLFN
jgi:hypothetical protein